MLQQLISLFLALSLVLALTACAHNESSSLPAVSSAPAASSAPDEETDTAAESSAPAESTAIVVTDVTEQYKTTFTGTLLTADGASAYTFRTDRSFSVVSTEGTRSGTWQVTTSDETRIVLTLTYEDGETNSYEFDTIPDVCIYLYDEHTGDLQQTLVVDIEAYQQTINADPAEGDADETASDALAAEDSSSSDAPAGVDSMSNVLTAIAIAKSGNSKEYSSADPEFFWSATAWLLQLQGMDYSGTVQTEDGSIVIPAAGVKQYAAALFADYDGAITELPELPEGMETISYDAAADTYTVVPLNENAAYTMSTGFFTDEGTGTYTLIATLELDGEFCGEYVVGLEDAPVLTDDVLFPYAVTNFVSCL